MTTIGRYVVPEGIALDVSESQLPYDVHLVVVLEGGRYVVDRLTAARRRGGPSVTTEDLRLVPVAKLMSRALLDRLFADRVCSVGSSVPNLEFVADTYRLAYACGLPPTKMVAEYLGIPTSTATKKVIAARQAGLLDVTTPGKAGG